MRHQGPDPVSDNQFAKISQALLTEIKDLFGISKGSLDKFRQRDGLPFIKITNTARLYLVRDVLDFIQNRRTVLNKAAREQDDQYTSSGD